MKIMAGGKQRVCTVFAHEEGIEETSRKTARDRERNKIIRKSSVLSVYNTLQT